MNKIAFNFYVNKCFRKAKRLANQHNKEYVIVNWQGGVWIMSKEHIEKTEQQGMVIKYIWPTTGGKQPCLG